jgi:hypothetical protein
MHLRSSEELTSRERSSCAMVRHRLTTLDLGLFKHKKTKSRSQKPRNIREHFSKVKDYFRTTPVFAAASKLLNRESSSAASG